MSLPPVSLPGAGAATPLAGGASTGSSMRRSASQLRLPDNAPPVRQTASTVQLNPVL